MAKLEEVAKYIRTKNAGPFWVTAEIFCDGEKEYETVRSSPNVSRATVAGLFRVKEEDVQIFYVPSLYVVKISFPRPYASGYRFERDMHFGQQYRLLAGIDL